MRKIFTLFLCLISVTVFSQTYQFNYQIESHYNGGMSDGESVYTSFYDSKSKTQLSLRSFSGKLRAVIFDKEKNIRHLFKVTEEKGAVAFEYLNTIKVDEDFNHIAKDIIEVTKIDSLQYKIVGFVDEKKKKKRFSADVTLEKSKMSYLTVGVDHAKTEEMQEKLQKLLDSDSTYIVKKIKLHYNTRVSYKIVNDFQVVDFKLSLPEKLNYKNDSYWGV
ncbi:hypothetical protein ASG31_06335 [Chryseobacterium sp. Leaf404]|uniref:hypothetical protein n=1 Tax=unclassified Chryseobacterium TaxID=2593645 RepID=UPI0006FE0AD9|nr:MULTISPECIES: hypothetical protein [unclassified Chryseobacterium]KQT18342.1 hypothetical protein ASG31_06335 [Chryseobacterium sp. Leaf404]